MKIKRPMTQQTEIVISVALHTSNNGHLSNATVSNMEYMLEYHEIGFDSVMEIIEQTLQEIYYSARDLAREIFVANI
ncbi:hypothetical protein Bca4012_063214 [Brassica carinata]|uniref:Uncharacterized protein n=1 Tax=Brassica carinata TaxID=52824 RepID=A0A8X7SF52_BRACI|nr:hypothetical protein Bca52824_032951 [Brassica carinata]